MLVQLVVASPPKADSQAEKLGVKKGDLILSINGLDAVKMDSFEVTDYLAKYQVRVIMLFYMVFYFFSRCRLQFFSSSLPRVT